MLTLAPLWPRQFSTGKTCGGAGSGGGVGVGREDVTGRMARMVTASMVVVDWPISDGAGIISVSGALFCRVSGDQNR